MYISLKKTKSPDAIFVLVPKLQLGNSVLEAQASCLAKLKLRYLGFPSWSLGTSANALSLTGEANKAGLDYRLIDPTAEDFAGSKINLAVGNMLNVYHQWESDKGTQLVFCDMSIPLSARTSYLSQDRRLYVRDDGSIEMKRGTMHTLEGHESLSYFVVQRGDKDIKRFDVYDAASGVRVLTDSFTKQEAIDSAIALLIDDNRRQDWIIKRETAREIEQEQIDEYNNDIEQLRNFDGTINEIFAQGSSLV